jgi:thiol-disulfide isomerase/thioredoxin
MMKLDKPIVRAPEFPPAVWLNTYTEVSLSTLLPNVLLLDFWDYTCINCLRTLPYLRAWHERYQDLGFEIVGVHTPEFHFARQPDFVKAAVGRLGLRWPTILDNNQEIWTTYANRYWPTVYLIDPQGYIRFSHAGEGGYTQIETAIQTLLREGNPELQLPSPLPVDQTENSVCAPTTQELHIDAFTNPLPGEDKPTEYQLPSDFPEGHFYLEGLWQLNHDGFTLVSENGIIVLPYSAADVYAVLSPEPQAFEYRKFEHSPLKVEILQDGQPLPVDYFGQDIFKINEQSMLRVDMPRNYHLVHNPAVHQHQLQLRILEPGLTLFAFSFGSCITPGSSEGNQEP